MQRLRIILIVVSCLAVFICNADNAPVTKAGMVLNASLNPATTTVPITVTGFMDIGSFTLTLDYSTGVLSYSSYSVNSAFQGVTINSSTPGRLIFTWPQSGTGITLPDLATLLSITFTYNTTGVCGYLTWYDNGNSCKYTKFAGGSYTALTDTPTSTFYINGAITNHPAPYTIAPVITNATTGSVSVPIKVANFYNIGSIYLNLVYASNVLTYVSYTQNGSIPGTIIVGSNPFSTNKRLITMSWFGPSFGLADSSVLITLNFTYANTSGNANYSELTWYDDDGSSCDYSDAQYHLLYDDKTSYFYKNGLVASQRAPRVWLPYMANATQGTSISLPVNTTGFSNVRSLTLTFEYLPAVMTYSSFTANAAFSGTMTVTDSQSGSKRKVVISWTGTSNLTLADGSTVVTLSFSYISGKSPLSWVTSDATSCRFNDNVGNAFYDYPKTMHYHDGLATSHEAPLTIARYASPANGQQVVIPVLVYRFTGIGYLYLTLDYDPGVLSYQSAALVPAIGGSFSATNPGPGRIIMSWSGSAATVADSTTLVNLTFNYSSGESALAWFDNGNSSRYAATSTDSAFYDMPPSTYYINGYIGSNPLVTNLSASNLLPQTNTTVTLTSSTSGSPASYFWSIRPSTYKFMNNTTEYSANPQVQFSANGAYTITLGIYRGTAAGARSRVDYIHAGTPGIWTGITSTDWNTGSNWNNYLVPSVSNDVTIPASAPYWPTINGNLTLGAHCSNLNLQGSSQLSVNGNLTINNGKSLVCSGANSILVSGNWSDSGSFTAGNSTVNFNGASDATLTSSGTETFHFIIISKSDARLTIPGPVNLTGGTKK
jgi:hypothetical protein